MGRKKKKARKTVSVKATPAAQVVNDVPLHEIRYRGFLTFRGLRLIALIFMTFSQLSIILLPAQRICNVLDISLGINAGFIRFLEICSNMSQASFAMLMVSTIGIVLCRQVSFKKMLIEYFVLALFTYIFIVFVLARTIHSFIYSLPTEIPELNEMLKELNFSDAVKNALVRIITAIVPGDGTVHIDALNTLLAALDINASVPELSQLISKIPGGATVQFIVSKIIEWISSQDLTPAISNLVDAIGKAVSGMPSEITTTLSNIILPWLYGLICKMLNSNVYWNLFLYTLFYFFITWQPPKLSPGKRMLFHCCAVLPGFWMVLSYFVSIQLRVFSTTQRPVWFIVLLTNINPATLVLFFLLVVFEKYNELEYANNPKFSQTGIDSYFKSNNVSLSFSVAASVMIIFICVGDYLLGLIKGLGNWGFGKSTMMWLCIPFLLLYSFNKQPKHKIFNAAVPLYYIVHYVSISFIAILIVVYIVGVLSGTYTAG